ncbi:MAG: hypothetical protein M3419_01620 [Actinomycetota bacterium]|nr:hypothetical protein [Actinomycetota bacterium]
MDGNVEVKGNARLFARGVVVGGNIQADNHRNVVVSPRTIGERSIRSRVEGDIQLISGRFGVVRGTVLGGNLQVKQNDGEQTAHNNVIDGDLQAFSNSGGYRIAGNHINGNLQCKSNRPAPVGGNNRVNGNKEGQCAAL